MRDATKIKQLADEAIKLVEASPDVLELHHQVMERLHEIYSIADRMDARTGKHDPSSSRSYQIFAKRVLGARSEKTEAGQLAKMVLELTGE